MKLQTDQENSDYFMRLGTTALSHFGGTVVAGEKAPKNSFKLKNKSNSLHQFYDYTGVWWPLLSNRQKNKDTCRTDPKVICGQSCAFIGKGIHIQSITRIEKITWTKNTGVTIQC